MKYKTLKEVRKEIIEEVVKEMNAQSITTDVLILAEHRLQTYLTACGKVSTNGKDEEMVVPEKIGGKNRIDD